MENSFGDYKILIGMLKRNQDSESLRMFFKLNLSNMIKNKYVCFLFVYDNNSSLTPILVRDLIVSDIQAHLLEYLTYKLNQDNIEKDNIFLLYENDLIKFANKELLLLEKEINILKKSNSLNTIKYLIVPNLDFFN